MRRAKMFALVSAIAALTAGAAVTMGIIPIARPPALAPADSETLVVPTERNKYFKQDIRFKLTLPSAYLHQKGETWKPPLNGVSFAVDLKDGRATGLTPIERPSVVVVALSVVAYQGVDRSVKDYVHLRRSDKGERWGEEIETRRYGLNYFTTIEYPGAPPKEFLFDNDFFHRTMIDCRPSGNAYPSLCTLTVVGERGGGINPQANAAVMTEIIFRHERLADWEIIRQQVEHFLGGKIIVSGWGN